MEILDDFLDDPELRAAVERQMVYSKIKDSLYKSYAKTFLSVDDIEDIPESLMLTLAGSKLLERGVNVPDEESFVIFQQSDPAFVVFSCKQDLQVLYQPADCFMDGTFKYRPIYMGFAQAYITFGLVNGESAAAVLALLPNKTYQQLLSLVKQLLTHHFGNAVL